MENWFQYQNVMRSSPNDHVNSLRLTFKTKLISIYEIQSLNRMLWCQELWNHCDCTWNLMNLYNWFLRNLRFVELDSNKTSWESSRLSQETFTFLIAKEEEKDWAEKERKRHAYKHLEVPSIIANHQHSTQSKRIPPALCML